MEDLMTRITETATEYVGRWNRLVSTTNWEKGRIIIEWREAMRQAGIPADQWTDEAWSRQVGGVTPQHVGRLRRVFERFGEVYQEYPGLYWSHFLAALDWPDAEMYLQGAVENKWSVSEMREKRWELSGAVLDQKPDDATFECGDVNEDFIESIESDADLEAAGDSTIGISSSTSDPLGKISEVKPPAGKKTDSGSHSDENLPATENIASNDVPRIRPFEALPPLPDDLKEAFEMMKLAILAHKITNWSEISRDDVLSVIESLKQLVLAPAE